MPGANETLVTVAIPARNESVHIRECLDSIRSQTYRNLDIVVVDGASTDDTAQIVLDIAREDPRVRLVENPAAVTPKSMNVALRNAQGKWFVRVDAHATVPPNYVEIAVGHLETGKWGAVGGRKDGIGLTNAGRAIAVAMASPFGVGNSPYHHADTIRTVGHVPFGAYPTDLVRELGGWDERLPTNQDYEFDWRVGEAGHELLFDPALRIDWICRQTNKALFKQYFRYGKGKARVGALHPASLKPRQVIPSLMVIWLIGALILLPFRPLLALLAVSPYVAFLAVGTARTVGPLQRGERWHVPVAFLAMQMGWGLGLLRGLFDLVRYGRRLQRLPR